MINVECSEGLILFYVIRRSRATRTRKPTPCTLACLSHSCVFQTAADNLLAEEFGDDYEESDVVELAQKLINHDIENEQAQEKVAEYVEAGTVMARAFINELNSDK